MLMMSLIFPSSNILLIIWMTFTFGRFWPRAPPVFWFIFLWTSWRSAVFTFSGWWPSSMAVLRLFIFILIYPVTGPPLAFWRYWPGVPSVLWLAPIPTSWGWPTSVMLSLCSYWSRPPSILMLCFFIPGFISPLFVMMPIINRFWPGPPMTVLQLSIPSFVYFLIGMAFNFHRFWPGPTSVLRVIFIWTSRGWPPSMVFKLHR